MTASTVNSHLLSLSSTMALGLPVRRFPPIGVGDGAGVGVEVGAGSGVAVGTGVAFGTGIGVGDGTEVGVGGTTAVAVGSGVEVDAVVSVGASVGTSVGAVANFGVGTGGGVSSGVAVRSSTTTDSGVDVGIWVGSDGFGSGVAVAATATPWLSSPESNAPTATRITIIIAKAPVPRKLPTIGSTGNPDLSCMGLAENPAGFDHSIFADGYLFQTSRPPNSPSGWNRMVIMKWVSFSYSYSIATIRGERR